MLPEEKARVKIDKQLRNAGWNIVSRNEYLPNNTTAVKKALMVFYCMISSNFMGKIQLASDGAATPIINKGKWGKLLIPLPPLAEQRRGANKISEILEII